MSDLTFSFVRVTGPLPSDLPNSGTFEDASRLAKAHKCAVLLHDFGYEKTISGPSGRAFRGSVGPDGSYTNQNLGDLRAILAEKLAYQLSDGRETSVWGERVEGQGIGRDFSTVRFREGQEPRVLFRTAESEGVATEDCTTPNWYVLAIHLHDQVDASPRLAIVAEGDALAAAVDLARANTVRRVYIYTMHGVIENVGHAHQIIPKGEYGDKGFCVGVAQARPKDRI